jgi:hypothetical protein
MDLGRALFLSPSTYKQVELCAWAYAITVYNPNLAILKITYGVSRTTDLSGGFGLHVY